MVRGYTMTLSVFLMFLYAFAVVVNGFLQKSTIATYSSTRPFINKKSSFFDTLLELRSSRSDDVAGDLTSALALLDNQWQIQQRSQPQSRWTKLILKEDRNGNTNAQEPDGYPQRNENDFVYLLEPPYKSIPSCLIVFTGGAGLGAYPQIAYNELLLRISNRLNAAVITAPYQVGLDHFALAKETGEKARKAIIQCQDDSSRLYPENLPVYALSHSLGAKLSVIYTAATDQEFDGLGLISFNNFGFAQTIAMAKDFAYTIRKNSFSGQTEREQANAYTSGVSEELINNIFAFAETAVSAIGIDFSPKPSDMERLISMKFTPDRLSKVRLFTFDDDQLQSTQQFVDACNGGGGLLKISGLPGTHLTPVFFKFSWDTISEEIPSDAKEMAREAMGGFESASFGDERQLDELVVEICNWIMGKEPSRKPEWIRERPKLAGAGDKS